jgi:tetratricopeptide (TPR) repeat protein
MDHEYLAALMRGEIQAVRKVKAPAAQEEAKTPLLADIDKQIDTYVDAMVFEEEDPRRSLISPKAKKDRLRMELKEAAKLPNLAPHIETATALLFAEGGRYLSSEAFKQLETEFSNLSQLHDVRLEDVASKDLSSIASISNNTMQSIAEIGSAKFAEERYSDCLALFALLSVLNSGNAEYWFRLGIAAQKCNDYNLANLAYAAASELDADNIGARLLSAECYVLRKLTMEAKEELTAAEEIAARTDVDPMWLDLLPTIKAMMS